MSIGRPSARAGIYAEQRYQRGLENWRNKTTPRLAVMFGPFMLAGLIILVMDRQGLSWFAGAIFGICAGVWIWVRDTPPRYIEKWHDGAEGERKTEKALKPLENAGWSVVHDVQCRYGNYDHIAVGPGGVYLLDTKNLQGIATVQDGVPVLNRRHDPEDIDKFQQILHEYEVPQRALRTRSNNAAATAFGCRLWSSSGQTSPNSK